MYIFISKTTPKIISFSSLWLKEINEGGNKSSLVTHTRPVLTTKHFWSHLLIMLRWVKKKPFTSIGLLTYLKLYLGFCKNVSCAKSISINPKQAFKQTVLTHSPPWQPSYHRGIITSNKHTSTRSSAQSLKNQSFMFLPCRSTLCPDPNLIQVLLTKVHTATHEFADYHPRS